MEQDLIDNDSDISGEMAYFGQMYIHVLYMKLWPIKMKCPYCGNKGFTQVEYVSGNLYQHIIIIYMFLGHVLLSVYSFLFYHALLSYYAVSKD